ncbi:MAG: mechanosensitive ion channel family protein [Acidobacteria bacterium]|nr:mechanosensitive ion channel family protein [Acidobacteriota bacterium]
MPMLVNARWDAFLAWMGAKGWIKLERLAIVVAVCLLLLYAVKLIGKAVRRAVDDGNDEVTTDAERRAETLSTVLNNAARVLVVVFFLLMTLQEFGVNIQPLLAGSAVAGVALGFGAQALVKDVISGFFLLMENQFGVGDIISVDDKHVGTVERMTLRVTQIRDAEGRAHYLPNGSITRLVVLSKDFARAQVDVEIGYDADLEKVLALLAEIGGKLAKDLPELVLEPTEVKGVEGFGKDGCTLRTLTKTAPGKQWDVAREYRKRILQRFRIEGIESPIPQRRVYSAARPVDPEPAPPGGE